VTGGDGTGSATGGWGAAADPQLATGGSLARATFDDSDSAISAEIDDRDSFAAVFMTAPLWPPSA
jgi:hypothetical protein